MKKINVRAIAFASVSDFVENNPSIHQNTLFIIDRDLKDGERGDLLASDINKMGYHNLYLSTSYDEVDFAKLPWLKGLIPKDLRFFFNEN